MWASLVSSQRHPPPYIPIAKARGITAAFDNIFQPSVEAPCKVSDAKTQEYDTDNICYHFYSDGDIHHGVIHISFPLSDQYVLKSLVPFNGR